MIRLEVFGEAETMASVAQLLDGSEDVTRVRLVDATKPGHAVVVAVVRPRAVDGVVDDLRRHSVTDDEVTLTREEVLGRSSGAGAEAGLVWEDVLGMASRNARPIARYLAFMVVAGVVGSYGVIDVNVILIVGAMAISPDLLPITAVGVGLVDRRFGLAARALVTLLIGMTLAAAAACLSASLQDVFGLIPAGFDIHSTVLGTLATVSNETIVVALAAGIAGMLALETRASAGVGVAVSVTTIPAAAYLGVAAGLGEADQARGALAVLAANVAMLVVGASGTLALQRLLARRARPAAARDAVRPLADPPGARPRGAGLELDDALAGAKGVRRARHRLDGEAPPVHVGQRVAGEELEVGVGVVRPDGHLHPAVLVLEVDPRDPVVVRLRGR